MVTIARILGGRGSGAFAASVGVLAGALLVVQDPAPALEPGALLVPAPARAVEFSVPVSLPAVPKVTPRWPEPTQRNDTTPTVAAPARDDEPQRPPPPPPPQDDPPPEPPPPVVVERPCRPLDITVEHGVEPVPEEICVTLD